MHTACKSISVVFVTLAAATLGAHPCAGFRVSLSGLGVSFPSPIAPRLETLFHTPDLLQEEAPTARGASRSTNTDLSWIDSFRCAEFLAEAKQLAPLEPLALRSTPSLAMIGSPNMDGATAFVSPEANSRPACCPNAPTKKSKSMRRRPDEENEAEVNSQLPVARRLAF